MIVSKRCSRCITLARKETLLYPSQVISEMIDRFLPNGEVIEEGLLGKIDYLFLSIFLGLSLFLGLGLGSRLPRPLLLRSLITLTSSALVYSRFVIIITGLTFHDGR